MPVYGKGRRLRTIYPTSPMQIRYIPKVKRAGHEKYEYRESRDWSEKRTSLRNLSSNLQVDFDAWIKKRHSESGRSVRILDWGCGVGTAISRLATNNENFVEAFGYSHCCVA